MYRIRALFEKISSDFRQDVNGLKNVGVTNNMRADNIMGNIEEGIQICNSYLYKMKPL